MNNNDAFVPRPFIFLHCCMNCKYGEKKMGTQGFIEGYYCLHMDDPYKKLLNATHICDVEPGDGNGDQIKWELKEEQ